MESKNVFPFFNQLGLFKLEHLFTKKMAFQKAFFVPILFTLYLLLGMEKVQAQCNAIAAVGGAPSPGGIIVAELLGDVDGSPAYLVPYTTPFVVTDMGSTFPTGTVVDIYVITTAVTDYVKVSTSNDPLQYSSYGWAYDGLQTLTPGVVGPHTLHYTLTAPARYIKFAIDAVTIGIDALDACPAPACATPVVSASAVQVTCDGSANANSDGMLVLNSYDSNAKKVDFNIGSTYTGSGFSSPSAVTVTGTSNFVVTSTLPNPTVNQPYTIRVFCDATTYKDKIVVLKPKQCKTSNMSLSISPATITGNLGELLTYTVTLTNAGPQANTNVNVKVPMPPVAAAEFMSATASNGTYDASSFIWSLPTVALGTSTLTFTVKVN